MRRIVVTTPFVLNLAEKQHTFNVGVHEVSDEVAEHWYTKNHSTEEEVEAPQPELEEVEETPEEETGEETPGEETSEEEAEDETSEEETEKEARPVRGRRGRR